MPIVVVHGVNVRDDSAFHDWKAAVVMNCTAFLKDLGGRAITSEPDVPFWGNHGATFAWNLSSIPQNRETLGSSDSLVEVVAPLSEQGDNHVLQMLLSRPFEEALGALSEVVSLVDSSLRPNIAALSLTLWQSFSSDQYALSDIACSATDDVDLVNKLTARLDKSSEREQLGYSFNEGLNLLKALLQRTAGICIDAAKRVKASLSSGVKRVGGATSAFILDRYRVSLHRSIATFTGDVLVYLANRHRANREKIQELVKESIRRVTAEKPLEPLILVGHSLGGIVLFEILADDPQISASALVTIGSQVSQFEEMKLLSGSVAGVPDANIRLASMPKNISRWLNVYDPVDVLAFRCEGIFRDVEDIEWNGHCSTLSAHGAYMFNPGLFALLSQKLTAPESL
jgi:hypothetical protein